MLDPEWPIELTRNRRVYRRTGQEEESECGGRGIEGGKRKKIENSAGGPGKIYQ